MNGGHTRPKRDHGEVSHKRAEPAADSSNNPHDASTTPAPDATNTAVNASASAKQEDGASPDSRDAQDGHGQIASTGDASADGSSQVVSTAVQVSTVKHVTEVASAVVTAGDVAALKAPIANAHSGASLGKAIAKAAEEPPAEKADSPANDPQGEAGAETGQPPTKEMLPALANKHAGTASHGSEKSLNAGSPDVGSPNGTAVAPQPLQVAAVNLAATGSDVLPDAGVAIEPQAKSVDNSGTKLVAPLAGGQNVLATDVASAESAQDAQETHPSSAADTMDQIVLGLKGKMDARNGKAEIRLDPPNLGALKVSVTLENGQLTAQFQSPSEVVRGLLKDNIEKLKTVLEGQGVTVDRLAVEAPPDVQTQGGQGNGQANFGSAAHDGRSAGQYHQDARSQQRQAESGTFAGLFSQAQDAAPAAPLDLVA